MKKEKRKVEGEFSLRKEKEKGKTVRDKKIITRLGIAGAIAIVTAGMVAASTLAGREEGSSFWPDERGRTLGIAGEETGWGTGEWAFGERRDVAEEAIEEMREAVRGAYEAAGIEYRPVEEVPAEFRGLSFEECMQRIHDTVEDISLSLLPEEEREGWLRRQLEFPDQRLVDSLLSIVEDERAGVIARNASVEELLSIMCGYACESELTGQIMENLFRLIWWDKLKFLKTDIVGRIFYDLTRLLERQPEFTELVTGFVWDVIRSKGNDIKLIMLRQIDSRHPGIRRILLEVALNRGEEDEEVRRVAISRLYDGYEREDEEQPEILELIWQTMNSGDKGSKLMALESIRYENHAVKDALLTIAQDRDEDEDVRKTAILKLGELDCNPAIVETLIQIAEQGDENLGVRAAASSYLSRATRDNISDIHSEWREARVRKNLRLLEPVLRPEFEKLLIGVVREMCRYPYMRGDARSILSDIKMIRRWAMARDADDRDFGFGSQRRSGQEQADFGDEDFGEVSSSVGGFSRGDGGRIGRVRPEELGEAEEGWADIDGQFIRYLEDVRPIVFDFPPDTEALIGVRNEIDSYRARLESLGVFSLRGGNELEYIQRILEEQRWPGVQEPSVLQGVRDDESDSVKSEGSYASGHPPPRSSSSSSSSSMARKTSGGYSDDEGDSVESERSYASGPPSPRSSSSSSMARKKPARDYSSYSLGQLLTRKAELDLKDRYSDDDSDYA